MRRACPFIAGVCIGPAMTDRAAATPDDVLKGLEDPLAGKHRWECAAANVDVLGRRQGTTGIVWFARGQPLTPGTVWAWGGSLTFGDSNHMHSCCGVTPA
jgi:hypothetical protein